MFKKLPESAIALTILFGLAGIPQIALSESKLVATTIAQADNEIEPETSENQREISWYWLLLLLIPIGLGGLLLARRTQADSDIRERDIYSTSTVEPSVVSTNDNLTRANNIPNSTEAEPILTKEPSSFEFDNDRAIDRDVETEDNELLTDNNNIASFPVIDRQADTIEDLQENKTTEDPEASGDRTAINTDVDRATKDTRSERDLLTGANSISRTEIDTKQVDLEPQANSSELNLNDLDEREIRLEEITFDDQSPVEPTTDSEEDEITDWLESLEGTETDGDLDEIAEWLNSLETDDESKVANGETPSVDADNDRDSYTSIEEAIYVTDDAFDELQSLLDEDSDRKQDF